MITLLAQAATTAGDAPLMWGVILAAAALFLLFLNSSSPRGDSLAVQRRGRARIRRRLLHLRHDHRAGGPGGLHLPRTDRALGRVQVVGRLAPRPADDPRAKDDPIDRSQAEGFAASQARMRDRAHRLDVLIGRRGTTETRLSPVGSIRIDGERYEPLAENGMLDAEVEIEVTEAMTTS